MTLNKYEVVYILKPDVTENDNLAMVNYYKVLIKKQGGQKVLVNHLGRRHLSYNITNCYDGIYVQLNYEGNGFIVRLIEQSMRLNDNILRYLTIKK